MLILIVLDTNVLVSSLLNPNGSPGKILDLIIGSQIQVVAQTGNADVDRSRIGYQCSCEQST